MPVLAALRGAIDEVCVVSSTRSDGGSVAGDYYRREPALMAPAADDVVAVMAVGDEAGAALPLLTLELHQVLQAVLLDGLTARETAGNVAGPALHRFVLDDENNWFGETLPDRR